MTEQAALDDTGGSTNSQKVAPEAVQTLCIPEPVLPIDLKEPPSCRDRNWNAKALEALAAQLTITNDFHDPLIASAQDLRDLAQELRELRGVNTALIELLRSVNPNSKAYTRFSHDTRGL